MKQIHFRSLKTGMYIMAYASRVNGIRQMIFFKIRETRKNKKRNRLERDIDLILDVQSRNRADGESSVKYVMSEILNRGQADMITLTASYTPNYEYFQLTEDEILKHVVAETI